MRAILPAGLASLTMALVLSGCQPPAEQPAAPAAETAPAAEAAPGADAAASAWPANLPVFGDGFPNAGDACRRVGESAATVDFLDDSASLVGCLTADDAMKLDGKVVAVIDGVTLVSVPTTWRPPARSHQSPAMPAAAASWSSTASAAEIQSEGDCSLHPSCGR